MCVSVESGLGGALAYTGAPRPLPSPQPAHNPKVSLDLASSEVTRIAARSAFWEFVTGTGVLGSGVKNCGSDPTSHTRRGRG